MPTTADRAASRPPAVAVHGLCMAYHGRTVLDEVDLTIHQGELFALLGPNGAGKTTTVEILEGYRRPSAGQVEVLGEDPLHAGEDWRARVGVVMQSWHDHARWRVGELLAHIAGYYPDPVPLPRLLDQVGLTGLQDRALGELSGGQRRRVDVALGLIGGPDLLFLDEPTTGFDPEARQSFHAMVEGLKDTGTTIVLTTHDLAEAERLADRIAILIAGRITATGTAAELAAMARAGAQVSWTEEGVRHTTTTPDPSGQVWELHQRLSGPIPDLQVSRPSLEETYLRLVTTGGQP